MRKRQTMVAVVGLVMVAVGTGFPQPAAAESKAEIRCIRRAMNSSFEIVLRACYRLSRRVLVEGTWITGFETNHFRAGPKPRRWTHEGWSTFLVFSTKAKEPRWNDSNGDLWAYRLRLWGRWSANKIYMGRRVLLVEDILVARRIVPPINGNWPPPPN